MKIFTDLDRADEVYGALIEHLRANRYPFNLASTDLPTDHVPARLKQPRNREQYAFFLFCLCYFMSATDSITATQCLSRLYADHPRYFKPGLAAKARPRLLASRLAEYGLGFREQDVAVWWIQDAQRLNQRADGRVIELLGSVTNFDQACGTLLKRRQDQGFLGFQHKMVSMILYYLIKEELIEYFPFPLPVDFHVLRLTLGTEVVTTDQPAGYNLYRPDVLKAIRDVTEDYARRNNVSSIELCDAIWPYGKAMCRYNPGNKTFQGEYAARSTTLEAYIPVWDQVDRSNWSRSCGSCAISASCSWNIPAARYYRRGELVLLSPRTNPPPDGQLAFFNHLFD